MKDNYDSYKKIYGINDEDLKEAFNVPNEVDLIKSSVEDECCLHKIDVNLYGSNFVFKLLDLIRDIYHTFGYDSYVLREYIVDEIEKIYGEGYKAKDILNCK